MTLLDQIIKLYRENQFQIAVELDGSFCRWLEFYTTANCTDERAFIRVLDLEIKEYLKSITFELPDGDRYEYSVEDLINAVYDDGACVWFMPDGEEFILCSVKPVQPDSTRYPVSCDTVAGYGIKPDAISLTLSAGIMDNIKELSSTFSAGHPIKHIALEPSDESVQDMSLMYSNGTEFDESVLDSIIVTQKVIRFQFSTVFAGDNFSCEIPNPY